jgi:hypothetical protein
MVRARWVATTLGVMALAAIIVSRQSEGDWRGSSDKVTLAQDRYAEARGEMNARGPAINKLLEHSVELETRLANQEKAERQMADAVQAAQRKVDALKAKDAKLHMVIGWPQRGGAMPTTYPAFGGLPSPEDGAVQADGDLYAYDSSKPDAVLVVDGTTGVTSGSWWDNPMDWFKAGSASKSREVPMIRAPWDAQASYAQASWPPTAPPSAAMPAEVERVKKLLDIQKTEEDLQKQKADVMDQIYADAQNGKLSNEAPVDAKVFAGLFSLYSRSVLCVKKVSVDTPKCSQRASSRARWRPRRRAWSSRASSPSSWSSRKPSSRSSRTLCTSSKRTRSPRLPPRLLLPPLPSLLPNTGLTPVKRDPSTGI